MGIGSSPAKKSVFGNYLGYTHHENAVITVSCALSSVAACVKVATESATYLEDQDEINALFKRICEILDEASIAAYKSLGVYFNATRNMILQGLGAKDYRESNFAFACKADDLLEENEERDTAKAMDYLTQSAEAGNQFAHYALGKLYLEEHGQKNAHYWFTQAAAQGNAYAQFFLDRWDNLKPPSVMLSATRLLHHMSRVFQEQTPTPSATSGIHVDKKLMAKIREKKIAMGHKPDDHEEPIQGPTMSM